MFYDKEEQLDEILTLSKDDLYGLDKKDLIEIISLFQHKLNSLNNKSDEAKEYLRMEIEEKNKQIKYFKREVEIYNKEIELLKKKIEILQK